MSDCVSGPNDRKLSDCGGWRAGCVEVARRRLEAASVTAGAVRCSAWLGVSGRMEETLKSVKDRATLDALDGACEQAGYECANDDAVPAWKLGEYGAIKVCGEQGGDEPEGRGEDRKDAAQASLRKTPGVEKR